MALALWAAAGPGPVAWAGGLDESGSRPGSSGPMLPRRCAAPAWPCHPRLPGGDGTQGACSCWGWRRRWRPPDTPLTLVLDDLHLPTDAAVLDGLDYVLRNAGAGLRLVASARMEPLPLHRYRLAGQLTEIRASDLAFTSAEAGQLLARHGVALTAESIESLTRRTEGWAAGLRLAAISMRTHPDPGQFVTELITDDSPLTAYLVAEVLNAQPPDVRDVLLSTSILGQASGEAARELTGNKRAAGILPAVARERVHPAARVWLVPLPPAVRRRAAAEAQPGGSRPGGLAAPAGGPVLRAERPAHRRGALRGRMRHAATAAAQAAAALTGDEPQVPPPVPAALIARAWVHLEHYELSGARSRLKEADAARARQLELI